MNYLNTIQSLINKFCFTGICLVDISCFQDVSFIYAWGNFPASTYTKKCHSSSQELSTPGS